MEDNWIQRSREMRCETCMFYIGFRCRRYAPTLQGYPAVYATDWCGEHKIDKQTMEILSIEKFKPNIKG